MDFLFEGEKGAANIVGVNPGTLRGEMKSIKNPYGCWSVENGRVGYQDHSPIQRPGAHAPAFFRASCLGFTQ